MKDTFDTTHLSVDRILRNGQVHRDYIAHCHRWSHVIHYLETRQKKYTRLATERYKTAKILDVGCGVDLPLYRVLCSNKFGSTLSYTGVDINKLELDRSRFSEKRKLQPVLLGETDIMSIKETDANVITSFEMLEHVPFEYAVATVNHLYSISPDDADFIVSTPVYDERVGMAKNHINEMTREVLSGMLTDAGWKIEKNFGTFASKRDLYPMLTDEHRRVYDELKKYYCHQQMATIFAPMYPEHSRNNLWVCRK